MTETDSRPPDPIAPLASVLSGAHDMGRQLALKHGLVADDGQLYCWECNRLGGTLPSLLCLPCLSGWQQKIERQRARERVEHPDNKRWRAAFAALSKNTFDRETAEKFVRAAEQMPGATPDRTRELWHIFNERFPEKSAPRNWGGRGFRRTEEG